MWYLSPLFPQVDAALLSRWWQAYLLTQLLEMPFYLWLFRDRPWPQRIFLSWLPSTITHPLVWFAFPWLATPRWLVWWLAEGFAVVTEAAIIRRCGIERAFVFALLINGWSALAGDLLQRFWGWP